MGPAIEYQKVMTEIVFVSLPGPAEPTPAMSGGELLHGFLTELSRAENPEIRNYIDLLCAKWSIHYRQKED